MPFSAFQAATIAYTGRKALASLGREWGVEVAAVDSSPELQAGKLIFGRVDPGKTIGDRGTQQYAEGAYANFVQAVVGSIGLHGNYTDTRTFVEAFVLSRTLDVSKIFEIVEPQREVAALCKREHMEAPVHRLIAESGRKTNSPIFVVGLYSGQEKLGEAQASNLKAAERMVCFQIVCPVLNQQKAASNALKGWYLFEDKSFTISGVTLEGPSQKHLPARIDTGDVIV